MVEHQLSFRFEKSLVVPPDEAQLPSILCSSPFFKPIANRSDADTKGFDDRHGESFKVGSFEMLRFGPGLDTYDFETLAALFQIINTKAKLPKEVMQGAEKAIVSGTNRLLPNFEDLDLGVSDGYSGTITHEYTFDLTSPFAVNRYLGRGTDAESLRLCRDSIIRLSRNKCDLINHKTGRRDDQVPFFMMHRNKRGAFLIIFPLQMETLFKVLLDFDLTIYRKLTNVGQAMMLWMSPIQGKYEILLDDARKMTNYHRPLKEFKRDLVTGRPTQNVSPILEVMESEMFISGWEIIGTGRKTPFFLSFTR